MHSGTNLRAITLTAVLSVLLLLSAGAARADDLSIIRQRLVASLIPKRAEDVKSIANGGDDLAKQMNAQFTWDDIDTHDATRHSWAMRKHLDRLLILAKACAIHRRDYQNASNLTPQTVGAIRYWVDHDFRNPNWWWNEIGVPQILGETLLLMQDDLPADLQSAIVRIMQRAVWTKWTGENLVWGVGIQISRALATSDLPLLRSAYDRLYDEIKVTEADGIQADDSFHQHGDQLYSGGYGMGYADDVGRYIYFAWGTSLQPPAQKTRIFSSYMLDGEAWITWRDVMDYSALGREIVRKAKVASSRSWTNGPIVPIGAAYSLGTTAALLASLPIERQAEYERWAKRLGGNTDAEDAMTGEKHFWRSDYSIYRGSNWMVSLKMHSPRVVNTEVVNGEGLLSHHLGDGNMFIYQTGNEYRDIFPIWDWEKLPGTTAEQGAKLKISERGANDFVGGASDGRIGVSAMNLRRGNLRAKKSWFFFDDAVLCLGAGINCDSDHRVITTVNQCFADGSDAITYGGDGIIVEKPHRVGSWHRLSESSPDNHVEGDLFLAYIDHGVRPKDAKYQYWMSLSGKKMAMEVLSNTNDVQAIRQNGMVMAVFYRAGRIADVEVDRPCIVMLGEDQKRMSVCDPTQKAGSVNIVVAGKRIEVKLPAEELAGESVLTNY